MNFEKIYIFCPTDVVSGGVNSLQILCKSLIVNNYDARLYYRNPAPEFLDHPVISSFGASYTTRIEDSDQNLLIVPEAYIAVLHQYRSVRKIIYWLGIYFYIKKPPHRFPLNIKIIRKIISGYSFFGNPGSRFHAFTQKVNLWSKMNDPIWSSGIIHFTNSYYAADFLKYMGVSHATVLHNPVREEFYYQKIKPERDKKILFGPTTPQRLINRISKSMDGYACIRLKKMPSADVHKHYCESILFIDLGDFAGRNRMPREAVLSGCAVITSRAGSAGYNSDLALDDFYKIDTNTRYVPGLINKIQAITGDYKKHYSRMQPYIDSLFRERESFDSDVAGVFKQI